MKKRWIVAIVCVALLGGMYAVDAIRATGYEYELIKSTYDTFIADGQSTVRITVKLSKNDKPVEGHTIYLFASNGTLPTSRCVTDENGEITFRYYPYVYLDDTLTPLEDVTIYLQDESNSLVFMKCAEAEFTFKVEKPEGTAEWNDWQNLLPKGGEE